MISIDEKSYIVIHTYLSFSGIFLKEREREREREWGVGTLACLIHKSTVGSFAKKWDIKGRQKYISIKKLVFDEMM